MRPTAIALALVALAAGCSSPTRLSREELLNPETCMECHPKQYEDWAGSMHAYAADDPVFLAMNELGQEQTNGDLGDFCVQCHAPMALREGLTTDGSELPDLDTPYRGVTCFFCHSVESVSDDHNNPLVLSDDLHMRGEVFDPVESNAHDSTYSALQDRTQVDESSSLCGACHDVVTPAGVHLERTYAEYQDSVFHKPANMGGLGCGGCHMQGFDDVIADVEGVRLRRRKEHAFPGIDVALTPWPGMEDQLAYIDRDLEGAIKPILCFNPDNGGQVEYTLDNVRGGHMLPSGAAQDRRMWAQVIATQGTDTILSTGVIADGDSVDAAAASDPQLWQVRDFAVDENGDPAEFFWQVRDVDSELLSASVTNDMSDPRFNHSLTRAFSLGSVGMPDRIEAQVQIRPIGLEVIDALIDAGKLDPAIRDQIPTLLVTGTRLVWTAEAAGSDLCVDRKSSAE